MVRELLSHRVANIKDPSLGAPIVDYAANPWVTYADLVDVFTPPQLDELGNPIKDVGQKEWREDARSVKGWNNVSSVSATASVEAEFKL
jgi:hypothetical protein